MYSRIKNCGEFYELVLTNRRFSSELKDVGGGRLKVVEVLEALSEVCSAIWHVSGYDPRPASDCPAEFSRIYHGTRSDNTLLACPYRVFLRDNFVFDDRPLDVKEGYQLHLSDEDLYQRSLNNSLGLYLLRDARDVAWFLTPPSQDIPGFHNFWVDRCLTRSVAVLVCVDDAKSLICYYREGVDQVMTLLEKTCSLSASTQGI